MTPYEVTMVASARMSHWWELNGQAENPMAAIRRIVSEVAPTQCALRCQLEDSLYDQWAQLCAQGGNEQ